MAVGNDVENGHKYNNDDKKLEFAREKSVSFHGDVVFGEELNKTDTSLSRTSTSSSSVITPTNGHGSSHGSGFSKLRSSLTREHKTNRDPLFYYTVTKVLGAGSMGDVKLVKKRANKVGGSARRDIQRAVQRQQKAKDCLEIPIVGGVFQLCIDADALTVDDNDNLHKNDSIRRLFSKNNSTRTSTTGTTTSRSFGDDSSAASSAKSVSNENNNASNSNYISFSKESKPSDIIYAMKSIHLTYLARQEFIDELRNEIAILKDLDHPNIVRAIETFEHHERIFVVMELCSGGDLYTRDPYSEPEAKRIVGSILSAVAYMHSKNVVHRDLKFENILFVNTSPMSEVKLIDFGLSKVYVDHRQHFTDVSGTIYTMAPEVLLGNHTEKADMWSIGVVAFMLLASALPFYGRERTDVARKILNNQYRFRGKRWRRVSDEAKEFISDSLLVLDPEQRIDAESALASPWLSSDAGRSQTSGRFPTADEEEMAKQSILRFARFPKLKQLGLMVVAHKSSSDEIGILRKVFQKYDANNDGSISFEEFSLALPSNDDHDTQDLRFVFDAVDLDGTGKIRYTEFIAATIEAHGAISEARLAEAFDLLDTDDSGHITAENLVDILGQEFPRDEINAIIAEADLYKTNRVSYSEFLALWEDDDQDEADNNINEETLEIVLGSEMSELSQTMRGMSSASIDEESDGSRAGFLLEKHLQNTLRTWTQEMQLPAKEFAMGCRFLHQAALGNQTDLEMTLQERPTFVNFRDYDRRTALHIAASEGHVKICAFLVERGARVNRSDRWGGFPLDDAHRHRHSEVVNLLRKHGAKFGSTSQTVNLITAASEGNVEEVRTLLEFGSIDLNQGDYDHRTALHLAANEGHLEVVKLLCTAGADVNVKDRWGETPLDDAKNAKKNSTKILEVLSGSVVVSSVDEQAAKMRDLKDQANQQMADTKPDEEMTQLPAQEFAMGCSLLHQAALGNQLVIEKLLQERPDLANFRDYDRRTALHIGASEGHVGVCRYLVAKGARINRVDRWGGSPLDDAHRHRHGEVVKFLRENGARFGSTSQVTNFITAASEGDREEVQAFLEFGSVDMNQGDYDRRTALHLAAGEGRLEIIELLCAAGADVNVTDRWGHRPLDDARDAKMNSKEIMTLLVQQGATSNEISTKLKITLLGIFT